MGAWRAGDPALPSGPPRLIYLDPPFATGATFSATVPVGERGSGRPDLRLPAYRDVWEGGLPGYLTFMYDLLTRLRSVLADDGWLCLHCDHRASAHLRLLLDELFGPDAFRNEIVWSYGLGNGTSRRGFPHKHDTLLLYAKSDTAVFTPVRGEVSPAMANKYRHTREDGTRFMRSYGREYDLKGGKPVGSVWEIPSVAPTSGERTGYPTQKPVALLERLILATTAPGDLVLDPCCGSGTTLLAASRLGRPSVGIDASPLAIAATRSRLVKAGVPVSVVREGGPIEAPRRRSGPPPRPLSGSPARSPAEGDARCAAAPQVPGEGSTPPSRAEISRVETVLVEPSDLSAFAPGETIGGHPAGPPRRYALSATVALDDRETDPTELIVTLDDLVIIATAAPQRGLAVRNGHLVRSDPDGPPLTGHWSDWLTGWAVHLGVHGPAAREPFTPAAWSFRSGRDRTFVASLPVPIPVGSAPTNLTLRLYDLFGAWSDHALPLTVG